MKLFKAAIVAMLVCCASVASAQFAIFQTALPTPASNPNLRQENVFGLTGSAWQSFTGNYTPGLGNPAVSTDDWYHSNGVYGMRPYDLLDPACGATGASIAASRGRYVWPVAPDHGAGSASVWNGSFYFRLGYSNDPGVLPSRAETVIYNINVPTTTAPIATFTGSISGTTLTVAAPVIGLITNDNHATLSGSGVTGGTLIASQSSGTAGKDGTYVVSVSQTVSSTAMTASQASYGIYQDPYIVCNSDDPTYPFYLYAEGAANGVQHEEGVIKSSDLITWTPAVPSHVGLTFNSWSSFQRVKRTSAGVWESVGFQVGYPQNGGAFSRSKWTSTDGLAWDPGTTTLNGCIPASSQVGTTTSCTGTSKYIETSSSPYTLTQGANQWVQGRINSYSSGIRQGSQWVGRAAVDSGMNVIDSPAAVNVSSAYAGVYPSQSYVQNVSGYVEDGIAHYYALTGWPISSQNWGTVRYAPYQNGGLCSSVPVANGTQGYFRVAGSISGTTLTVTSVPVNSVVIGGLIYNGGINLGTSTYITGQINGTPGGAGDYTVSISQTVGASTFDGALCGGLWQQGLDYYTEIIDAGAAAGAAPVGVRVSCAASTASLTWYDSLPTQTYRLYRGTSAGSQPTLVGDFTGTAATDSGMTPNAVTWYKLVYLNGGVEQRDRVVSTYCSTSSAFVNAHLTRAAAGGADMATCNRTFMDTFDAWLVSNGLSNNLLFASMPEFCVSQSGNVTKIFDMGTTRLPRGGDYTPLTSNTTYNATGIGGKPAWVNSTGSAYGYYGGTAAYLNNIRRQTQITLFAAYQKPGTAALNPFAIGQFGNRMMLSHTSGSPGAINCLLSDATQQQTATATVVSATAFNTSACTFDGTTWLAYSNATAGSGLTGLVIPSPNLNPPDMLTGQIGVATNINVLISGSDQGQFNSSAATYSPSGSAALGSFRAQMIFDKALSGTQVTSLDALVR